jgi:hypothetical protein
MTNAVERYCAIANNYAQAAAAADAATPAAATCYVFSELAASNANAEHSLITSRFFDGSVLCRLISSAQVQLSAKDDL